MKLNNIINNIVFIFFSVPMHIWLQVCQNFWVPLHIVLVVFYRRIFQLEVVLQQSVWSLGPFGVYFPWYEVFILLISTQVRVFFSHSISWRQFTIVILSILALRLERIYSIFGCSIFIQASILIVLQSSKLATGKKIVIRHRKFILGGQFILLGIILELITATTISIILRKSICSPINIILFELEILLFYLLTFIRLGIAISKSVLEFTLV